MPVPQNARQIFSWLTAHGYTPVAAAGILGNIAQESGGSPEAGGPGNAGIIQWTPEGKARPYANIITGNPTIDLTHQLDDLIYWNNTSGAGPAFMNRATTPDEAATLYMNQAERPDPALANLPNRQASAAATFNAYKSGHWPAGDATTESGGGGGSGAGGGQAELTSFLSKPSGVLGDAGSLLHGSAVVLDRVYGMFAPGQGWRIIFAVTAIVLLYASYRSFGGSL